MATENKQSARDLNLIGRLLTPSWLSGLIVIVISLVVVFGAIVEVHYHGSSVHYLAELQQQKTASVYREYQPLASRLSASQLISDIPLFIFWMGIGLVAYSFTMAIAGALRTAVELEHELDYVHVDRRALVRQAMQRLGLRLGALAVWLIYMQYTQHVLLPYVLAVTYAGSAVGSILYGAGYVLGAIGLLVGCLHLHVVLLRLLFLRPRIFGQGVGGK